MQVLIFSCSAAMDNSGNVIPTELLAIKRWTCFIAAILLQSINGTNFDFSDYSSDLKKDMGINQIQLNSLAVASDLGKVMGWVCVSLLHKGRLSYFLF